MEPVTTGYHGNLMNSQARQYSYIVLEVEIDLVNPNSIEMLR